MQSAAVLFGKKLFYVYSGCCQLWNENEPRTASLEFDRDRKSMGVIVNSRAGKKSLLVKVYSPFLNVCVTGGLVYGACSFSVYFDLSISYTHH